MLLLSILLKIWYNQFAIWGQFIVIFFSMALPAHSGPRPLIQFRNHFSQTVGFLGRGISPLQGHYLHTGQHKHRINAYTHQTSMPWVGLEPTIPASERAKTVHAIERGYCDRQFILVAIIKYLAANNTTAMVTRTSEMVTTFLSTCSPIQWVPRPLSPGVKR
jgi:hypothetical protein